MKFYLTKIIAGLVIISFNTSNANSFDVKYDVIASGIKIGEFNWFLSVDNGNYITEINLKNSGLFSPLYKFNGKYTSTGVIENEMFKADEYKQYWKTKKKVKIVEISFDNFVANLKQIPEEKELPRVEIDKLFLYFDPITSFLNILNGFDDVKTIDGRRIYIMKKNKLSSENKITLEIKDYINIWADHKRNDLKKIDFFINDEIYLPEQIEIYFKKRVFKLKKN